MCTFNCVQVQDHLRFIDFTSERDVFTRFLFVRSFYESTHIREMIVRSNLGWFLRNILIMRPLKNKFNQTLDMNIHTNAVRSYPASILPPRSQILSCTLHTAVHSPLNHLCWVYVEYMIHNECTDVCLMI